MTRPANFANALVWTLCVLCAFSIQTQITLFSSETYLGLRINLTDIIAPFAGIAILVTLLRRQSVWPDLKMPYIYHWLAALTLILGGALLYGWHLYGELSHWALVNKFCGWFILLAIMGLGAWIAANARRAQLELLLKITLYFLLAFVLLETLVLSLQSFSSLQAWIPRNDFIATPIDGLMANRNAYSFLYVAVFAISTNFYFSNTPLIKPNYSYILFFLLPFFVVFNASRASWVTLALIFLIMAVLNWHQKKKVFKLAACLLIGTAILALVLMDTQRRQEVNYISPRMLEILEGTPETHAGDIMRVTIIKMAWPMVRERPLLGSGLGSAMIEQQRQTGAIINLIDNTSLWLLVETGVVGLLTFLGFYIVVTRNLFQRLKDDDEFSKTLRQSVLYIIFGFTLMCLLHELLYTRFLWFFLGLALALPARMRQDV